MKLILIVDDDPAMRGHLESLLRSQYAVVAKSSMEAHSWLSVKNFPDLIICDLRMPAMDGIELLENLRCSDLYKNIPVIVLTAFAEPLTPKRCRDLGAYECLVKPFNPNELLEKVAYPLVSKNVLIKN